MCIFGTDILSTSVLPGPHALKDKCCPISPCDFLVRCLFNTLVPIVLPKRSLN